MGKKYQSINPSNARVLIDYRNKEHPVRFQYPAKKSPFKIVLSGYYFLWIYLHMIFCLISIVIAFIVLLIIYFPLLIQGDFSSISSQIDWSGLILTLAFAFHLFFIPLLATLITINNKKLLSYMPQINMFSSLLLGYSFHKKITNLDSTTYKLPLFSNVFLDYKTKGEFAKYLYKVEIKEHDLKFRRRKWFFKIKDMKNDYLWYAEFKFKKIPKTGYLEISFK